MNYDDADADPDDLPMSATIFYVTVSANMPFGPGYWEIHADTMEAAREKAFKNIPDGRWSFLYTKLEDVHPLDRKCHGVIE